LTRVSIPARTSLSALWREVDGKILVGGDFTTLGGGTRITPRNSIGRLTNTAAAFQELAVDTSGTTIN